MRLRAISLGILLFGTIGAAAADDHVRAIMHFRSVNELSPRERLEAACDAADYLRDDLKGKKLGKDATSNLNALHDLVCGSSYKPTPAKSQP
jgi:hypothetical protein